MTKEELEKEAREWLDDERKYIIEDDEGFLINIAKKVKEAYLASAEAREKRIAKLEEQLTKAKELLKMVIDWQSRCGNGHPAWQEVCAKIEQFISEEN